MNNFNFFAPTQVVFGTDTHKEVGELIKSYGASKVLIHHYGGEVESIEKIICEVKESLTQSGLDFVILDGIVPNPRLSKVYEGIELCKKENIDFILAIGGGSAIDSSKAIGLGTANTGDVWDFYTGDRIPNDCVPVATILTIPASGSEMSAGSVITKGETGEKKVNYHQSTACKFAIMNPDITLSLPPFQTACGNADIVFHTLERYLTVGEHLDITSSIAEGLMRSVIKNGKILKDNPNDKKARWEVMWAGSLSHNGLTGCGIDFTDYPLHIMGHELSGHFDVTHGASMTVLFKSWATSVLNEHLDRFYSLATNVFEIPKDETKKTEIALLGIEKMTEFFSYIGAPTGFSQLRNLENLKIDDDTLLAMAQSATQYHIENPTVPYMLSAEEAFKIYKKAQEL